MKLYRWRHAIGVLIAGGLTAICFAFWPHDPQLSSKANRIVQVPDYVDVRSAYYWLPNGDLVYFQNNGIHDNALAYLYCPSTHSVTELTTLSYLLSHGDGDAEPEITPDGHWVLWWTKTLRTLEAAHLDGSQHQHWRNTWQANVLCMSDGKHWVGYQGEPQDDFYKDVIIGSVDDPHMIDMIPIQPPIHGFFLPDYVISENSALKINFDANNRQAFVREVSLKNLNKPIRQFTLNAPGQSIIEDIQPAPDVCHLAWLVRDNEQTSLGDLLARLLPILKISPKKRTTIWVSRQDGSDMHEIGYLVTDLYGDRSTYPQALRWTPDGKRLSFVLHNSLWTVPVE